jgi:hypothetical protein
MDKQANPGNYGTVETQRRLPIFGGKPTSHFRCESNIPRFALTETATLFLVMDSSHKVTSYCNSLLAALYR